MISWTFVVGFVFIYIILYSFCFNLLLFFQLKFLGLLFLKDVLNICCWVRFPLYFIICSWFEKFTLYTKDFWNFIFGWFPRDLCLALTSSFILYYMHLLFVWYTFLKCFLTFLERCEFPFIAHFLYTLLYEALFNLIPFWEMFFLRVSVLICSYRFESRNRCFFNFFY